MRNNFHDLLIIAVLAVSDMACAWMGRFVAKSALSLNIFLNSGYEFV